MRPFCPNRLPAIIAALVSVVACTPTPPPGTTLLEVPANSGSMAPNISDNSDGTLLLSWIEPDGEGHALKYSRLQDRHWTPAQMVTSGHNWFVNWADFPSVVSLSEKRLAAHWLVSREAGGYAYDVHAAFSSDAGASWSAPFTPHTDDTDTEHGFVSLFNDADRLGMVWLDGRKMINEFDTHNVHASGMTLRAGTFDDDGQAVDEALLDDLVCDCCQTDVAVTPEGPIAIFRNRTNDERRDIYVARRVAGKWQPGVAVNEDQWDIAACPVNGPTVHASGNTVVAAWFTAAHDAPAVKVAWSEDAGRSFSAPVLVDADDPLGHVGSALLPDGDLAISWVRSDGKGGGRLLLRRISANGKNGAEYAVRVAEDFFAFSVPQLAYAGDSLVVAWTAEKDGIYRVGSAAVPLSLLD